jgi:hypothetical protein
LIPCTAPKSSQGANANAVDSREGCIYPDSNALWRLAVLGGSSPTKIRSLAVTHAGFDRLCDFDAPELPFGCGWLVNFNLAEAIPRYENLRKLIFIWQEQHEQAPALLEHWDEEVHDVQGDAFPILSEEFMQAEREVDDMYADEPRGSQKLWQALDNLKALIVW